MKSLSTIFVSTIALCVSAPGIAQAQADLAAPAPPAAPPSGGSAAPLGTPAASDAKAASSAAPDRAAPDRAAPDSAAPSSGPVSTVPASTTVPSSSGPGSAVATVAAPPSAVQAELSRERRYTFWGSEPGRPADENDIAISPSVPIRFSAYTWLDTGYMKQRNQQVGAFDKDVNYAQGRFVLGASYRYDMGPIFAEARAQLVAFDNEYTKSQYEPHTQDAFVRIGGRVWDLQVGRFLAWEPYYRGNGIDRYTAEENGALGGPTMYRLDYTLGYKDEPGQAAFHLYPTDWMAFELGSVYGQESSQNTLGVRPVLAFRRFGFLLTGGWEYATQKPQDSSSKVKQSENGAAGRLAYTLAGTTLGVDVSHVKVEAWQIDGQVNAASSFDKTSVGGYIESDFWHNVIGAGYHYTISDNEKSEHNGHHQLFVSYGYRLPVRGLMVSGVFGFARAALEDADAKSSWENDMTSFRVRIRYDMR